MNLNDLNKELFDSIQRIKAANNEDRAAMIEQNHAIVETAKTIIINSQLQLTIAKAISQQHVNAAELPKALLPESVTYQGNCRVINHVRKNG